MVEETKVEENSVDISTPGGIKVSAHGRVAGAVAVIGLCFISILAVFHYHDMKDQERMQTIMTNQNVIIDKFAEITYILSLSQEKREKLHLDMPESLRKRLRQQSFDN